MTVQREPVGRAIDVLVWMSEHAKTPWSVRQVARDLKTSPTTVHRIFTIFEGRGLLQKDGNGGYLPSLGLYKLCRLIVGQDLPVAVARPHLDALLEETGETVMLGAYEGKLGMMMYIDVRHTRHPIQHMVVANEWRPIYAGATGLAILAFLSEAERREIYDRGMAPLTDRTVIDIDELENNLAKIRRAGYARTLGQHRVGAVGIAAPVFDCDGDVFGDVCLTIPEQRFQERLTKPLGTAVMATANAITAGLRSAGHRRGFA